MWRDPIVDEVRKAGKELSEKCENNPHKFAEMIKEQEKKRKKEGWQFYSEEKTPDTDKKIKKKRL